VETMESLKIKEIRKERRLSISQLSHESGVARGYLSEMESGKYNNPSLFITCKLCKALKVEPNDLINKELWKW